MELNLDNDGVICNLGPGTYFIGDPLYVLTAKAQEEFYKSDCIDGAYDGYAIIHCGEINNWVEDNVGEQYHISEYIGVVNSDNMKKQTGDPIEDLNILSPMQLIQLGWLIKVQKKLALSYIYETKMLSLIIDGEMRTLDLNNVIHPLTHQELLSEVQAQVNEITEECKSLLDLGECITSELSQEEIEDRAFQLKHPILYKIRSWFIH